MNKERIIELLGSYKEREARIKMIDKEVKHNKSKLYKLRENIGKISSSNMDGIINGNSVREVSKTVEKEVTHLVDKDINIKEKICNLMQEKKVLKEMQEDMDIRLFSLTVKENRIVKARYIEQQETEYIGSTIYLELTNQTRDNRTVNRDLNRALNKMISI